MTTFALIHGAWHGGWCWDRVAPRLREAGHRVVAPDLPCDVVGAGAADYAAVVVDALRDGHADEDVIVVAHSAGGLTAPLVAAETGARAVVLLAALLPRPGRTFAEQNAEEHVLLSDYQAGVRRDDQGCSRWVDREIARDHLYNGCAPDDAAWAYERLRPQAPTIFGEPGPRHPWRSAAVVDVRAGEDRLVSPQWARGAVAERLGLESIVLEGVGHSPMLSHPQRIAEILLAA